MLVLIITSDSSPFSQEILNGHQNHRSRAAAKEVRVRNSARPGPHSPRQIGVAVVAKIREEVCVHLSQSGQGRHMIWPGFGMGGQLRNALAERARHRALHEQKLPSNGGRFADNAQTRHFESTGSELDSASHFPIDLHQSVNESSGATPSCPCASPVKTTDSTVNPSKRS